MEMTQILPWAIVVVITLGVWALGAYLTASSRTDERLDELRDPKQRRREEVGTKQTGLAALLQKAAPKLSKALQPKTELEQNKLKVRLANAGFHSPHAEQIFLAIQFISLLAGLGLGAGFGLPFLGLGQLGLTTVVIGGGLGFYLPTIVVALLKKSRQEKIFLSLPDALDLLVVCVESGLGLDAGMLRVAEELNDTAPEVCSEFHMANMQLQMGRPRQEVLHDLGVRTGVDDVRALAAILIQADKFGSSIAKALRVQSDSMRTKRSQMAEEKAQQTAVKMLFPLVLFIFPGIFVVLVGPAAIMLINQLLTK